jgi:hypothetical protein
MSLPATVLFPEPELPLSSKALLYHDRITHLHLKDRKRDDGPNMPWGEGRL